MKTHKTGQEKIKEICEILRKDTLEPAKQEGVEIIAEAKAEAEKIIQAAKDEAEKIFNDTRKRMQQEKSVFQSALGQASKQSLEELKQMIHSKIFDEELYDKVVGKVNDPDLISSIISTIISALERDGIDTDISAVISQTVSPDEINTLLGESIIKKLKEQSVFVGDFVGGAMVRLHGKKIVLDVSGEALKDLLATHLRKDFRKILFSS